MTSTPELSCGRCGTGCPLHEVEEALEHHSGLLGLSGGRSSDMQELLAAQSQGDTAAALAVRVYLHRLRAKIAGHGRGRAAVSTPSFSPAGVGENVCGDSR